MEKQYLWDGLNTEKFAIVAIWPQNKNGAVILMRSRRLKNDPKPWCIEYRGSGQYFETVQQAFDYCEQRKFKLETFQETKL